MKGRRSADLIRIIEACYEVEQPREDWLRGTMRAAESLLSPSAGLGATLYDLSDGSLRTEMVLAHKTPAGWDEMGWEMHNHPALKDGIADGYRNVLCGTMREALENATADFIHRYYRRFGLEDGVMVNGLDALGSGAALYAFSTQTFELSAQARELMSRVATHLATGHRLQRRIAESPSGEQPPVEAVLKPNGHVEHAEPAARSKQARDDLTEAVRLREWARGTARRDELNSVTAWHGLVRGRWTLVDQFQSGGRRYILARENVPVARGPSTLSDREKQVVTLATLGRSNKLIAYELGLAHSTVRVLLARAATKLGLASRGELVEYWRRRHSQA